MDEVLLSATQVGRVLGVHGMTVRNMVKDGRLPCTGGYVWSSDQVRDYLEAEYQVKLDRLKRVEQMEEIKRSLEEA